MALTVAVVDKPVNGVTLTDIPAELVELLVANVPQCLYINPDLESNEKTAGNPENIQRDKELQFDADSKGEAEKYAGYARAWGMRQNPKVEIRRQTPRRDQPETRVRLKVELYDPNAPRPGRPSGSKNQTQ